MESTEISREEIRIFDFVERSVGWFTARQAIAATGVKPRTARRHLARFAELRILQRARTFGGCHYKRRLDKLDLGARSLNYLAELNAAKEAFENVKPGLLMRLLFWRPAPYLHRYRRDPSGHGQMMQSNYHEAVRNYNA